MIRLIVCLFFLTGLGGASGRSLVQEAPANSSLKKNPYDGNDVAIRAGGKLYARQCASCHGKNREGRDHTPPLAHSAIYDANPGSLFWVLTHGNVHKGMPSFAHLPAEQRWQIVTFLRDAAQ